MVSPRSVRYHAVQAKSITRLRGIVDPWFLGRYGMNLYRGCEHGCLYCDGRAERYYVAGDFARDIAVKVNAVEVLDRELGRAREPGFVFLGGGVCDGYQPAEEHYQLARGVLEVALRHRLPVHVLTKSGLVERDLDLLGRIQQQRSAILSFSIQTLDEQLRERFEPAAAPIAQRLRLLAEAKQLGLGTGVMAMPVLPGLSDTPAAIDSLVAELARVGVDFVCFGALTLRPGVQKDTYLAEIRRQAPKLLEGYRRAYHDERRSGAPDERYRRRVDQRFAAALDRHGLPARAPWRLFRGMLPLYAELGVRLEHREQQRCMAGLAAHGLGHAGFQIQCWAREQLARRGRRKSFHYRQLEEELEGMIAEGTLTDLPGVPPRALAVLRELCAESRAVP